MEYWGPRVKYALLFRVIKYLLTTLVNAFLRHLVLEAAWEEDADE